MLHKTENFLYFLIDGIIICANGSSLVISPHRYANIARFVSGVNNHYSEKVIRSIVNVECMRFNVDNEARVFLFTKRDISSGERLVYDYNGLDFQFDTERFT